MQRVALVDHGTGNLHSLLCALRQAAAGRMTVEIAGNRQQLLAADRVVFPGQGAMHEGYRHLVDNDLWLTLREVCQSRPFFGVCLGLHCLLRHSEESNREGKLTEGLGLLSGSARRLPTGLHDEYGVLCKIPHMGWNRIHTRSDHPLLHGIPSGSYFYFAHSYYTQAVDNDQVMATTRHGLEFPSIMAKENLFATQFHPEKSGQDGLRLLRAFLDWDV